MDTNIVPAMKNTDDRQNLSTEKQAQLPETLREIELIDADLEAIYGAGGPLDFIPLVGPALGGVAGGI